MIALCIWFADVCIDEIISEDGGLHVHRLPQGKDSWPRHRLGQSRLDDVKWQGSLVPLLLAVHGGYGQALG